MQQLRTWIEIDKAAIKNNYKIFRAVIGKDCKLMAVAKSNAYGHSILDFAREIGRLGADWLGVDSIVEALTLRRVGIKKPILVLGFTLPLYYDAAAREEISLTVSSRDSLQKLSKSKTGRKLKLHVKLDTGMHRQGFFMQEVPAVASFFRKNPRFVLEGVYTHFAAAKNPSFPGDTEKQLGEFLRAVSVFQAAGFRFIKHAAATSGALIFPQSRLDMVRIGIGLYGLWPSPEVKTFCEDKINLKPALHWKTLVSEVKKLPAGERVGYDFTETLLKSAMLAVLPVGYWHGFPRLLSSIGHVVIKGRRARVIGRVSMDMITVDISKIKNVRVGDVATLIGDGVSADEVAELSSTTNYEIVTRLNPLIKRIYHN